MTDVSQVLDLKAVEAQMMATHNALEGYIAKANAEIEGAKSVSAETKSAVDKLAQQAIKLGDKLADLEQKGVRAMQETGEFKTPGALLTEDADYKTMLDRKSGSARIEVKTAIVNATTLNMSQPLVPGQRLDGGVSAPDRVLRIRDVLPGGRTNSNYIFYPKENVFTNSAAVVVGGSPTVGTGGNAENVSKPESAITFTNGEAKVVTIAHFIPISKQVLDDSPFVQSYVDSRLLYGLKLKEETELLAGAGTLGTMSGINTQATAYVESGSPLGFSDIDKIRDAKRQAEVANYEVSVVILNPTDWFNIEIAKDDESRYLVGNPQGVLSQNLWGLRVVVSNSQTAGTFTVLAPNVCQIFDREEASVQISYEEGNNFTKNMATILAEERLALAVYNAGGIIKGTF